MTGWRHATPEEHTRAVERFEAGVDCALVAEEFDRSLATVRIWFDRYKRGQPLAMKDWPEDDYRSVSANKDRDAAIVDAYKSGNHTLKTLGDKFRLTPERVRQIVKKAARQP